MKTQERPRGASVVETPIAPPATRPTISPERSPEPAPPPTRPEPAVNGAAVPARATATAPTPPPVVREPARRGRSLRRWLLIPLLLVALAVAGGVGYRYWYEDTHYVSTENASITGALVQFGSLNAGRVAAVNVDVGARVVARTEVAQVTLPAAVSATSDGASRLAYTGADDQRVPVIAPVSGIVAARLSNPGDTVQAGQAMLAIVDPRQLWVQANIEETRVGRLAVGQYVEIRLDSLDRTVGGRVQAITPATASSFSLLPQQNTTGNFNKITQLVPVKIVFENPDLPLTLGSSVEVKIHIRADD